MFPMGDPSRADSRPVSVEDFRRMPPSETVIRNESEDPLLAASEVYGARMVPSREFRMVGAEGQLELPLVPTDF